MTTTQLNVELFHQLNIIVGNESMMEKAVKALRRITSPRVRMTKAKAAGNTIDWDSLPELPDEFVQLRGMGHVTQEDMNNDDRLAYIMGK